MFKTTMFIIRYRTQANMRTQLLDSSVWKVSDDTVVTVLDLAGHKCYAPSVPFVLKNVKSSVAVVVHSITSDDYKGRIVTFQFYFDGSSLGK